MDLHSIEQKKLYRQINNSGNLPDKVTLITPPSIFLLDERVFTNLGILKVASSLEKFLINVDHLDLSGVSNYLEALESYILKTNSKIVGITVTTPQLPIVVNIVNHIRKLSPSIKIILGGPHITLTYSAFKLENKKKM